MAINFNPSVSGVSAGGPIQTSRPAVTKAEVQPETTVPGEQVTLSGHRAPAETPAPGPAANPAPAETPRETPKHAPAEQPAPGPGISNGQGGTLLMTETPAGEHSASIDGFLSKFLPAGGPQSTRTPDLEALKLSPDTVSAQNMKFMNSPAEAKEHFNKLMGDKPVQLATAGYSAPPEGYEAPTTKFLSGLAAELDGKIGLVTSPTADKGSIDAITSTVGQRAGAPLGYITADSYLGYVNPDNFPTDIDKNQFSSQPKLAFPDADIYSKATAELSNSFLVTGGRNASINDFKNAVLNGNQVVVLTNDDVKAPSWDPKKNRVDNASAYLSQMMSGDTTGIPMDNPFNQETAKFLAENKEAIAKQVISVDANDAGAIKQAASHLQGVSAVVTPDQINFDSGSQVVSSAQKFVIPVPNFADGGEPLVYPQGATNKKGEDLSGKPIADWQGNPIGDRGVVFYNEKDKAWQGVPGDGNGVVIMNQVSEDQSKLLLEKAGGDPSKLSLQEFKEVLTFANKEVGLGDMYNSDRGFISSKMNPLETQDTGVPQYGMFRRDDRDVCHALFVEGSGEFKGTSTVHQYDNGGVVLRQKVGNEFNYRLIQPEEFHQTYNNKDGSRIDLDSLPRA